MAKFYGVIGYGTSTETAPGVHVDVITEKSYYGDVINYNRSLQDGEGLNQNIIVNNTISIVADEFMFANYFAIRYIRWNSILWTITKVEVKRPRLILSLGEVYNGPTP